MNQWLIHVADFRKKHPKMSYKEALQEARKTYKPTKSMKGGDIFNKRSGKTKMDFTKLNLEPMKPMKGGSKKMGINPKSMKGVKTMTGGSLLSDAFTFSGEKPKYKR